MRQSIYFYTAIHYREQNYLLRPQLITTDTLQTNGGLFLSSVGVLDVMLKSPALNYKLGDVLPQFFDNLDSKEDRLQTDPIYL